MPLDLSNIAAAFKSIAPASAHERIDRYADGRVVSSRRLQKAEALSECILRLTSGRAGLRVVDFGCADGAVPVTLLRGTVGTAIAEIIGITLLDYNGLGAKPAHDHPRFVRLVGDLEDDLDVLPLPWGECDVVTATAFFHYLRRPEIAMNHAARLLKPGGLMIMAQPHPWLLRWRRGGCAGLRLKNSRIRRIETLDTWSGMATSSGFVEVERRAVQWLGTRWTGRAEVWLRNNQLVRVPGSNYFLVFRRARVSGK